MKETILVILVLIQLLSMMKLCVLYSENNIEPGLWSILGMVLPVVNTVLIFYILCENGWKFNFKDFVRRIKGESFKEFMGKLKGE